MRDSCSSLRVLVLLAHDHSARDRMGLAGEGKTQGGGRACCGRSSRPIRRDGEARLFLGSILAEDGRRQQARFEQLTEAVRLMPRSAMAHNALGEALEHCRQT